MKSRILLSAAALSLVALGGCAVVPGPYGPQVVPAPVVVTPAYRQPYVYPAPAVVYPSYGGGWYGRGYGGRGYGRGHYR
ncbi:MAG TPA: hypothetical protein PK359_13005 [Burkholderiaceae bacterium]|jgi:hypothetical protein|nr:hypothetical protein [Burkholderiaceae bacterium]